jgi:hypothetical protein
VDHDGRSAFWLYRDYHSWSLGFGNTVSQLLALVIPWAMIVDDDVLGVSWRIPEEIENCDSEIRISPG